MAQAFKAKKIFILKASAPDLLYSYSVSAAELEALDIVSSFQVMMAQTPEPMNMNTATRDQMGWNHPMKQLLSFIRNHLKDTLLNVFSTINDVPDDEDNVDDGEGDQGGVAQVLHVNVGVGVAKLQCSGGEEDVVTIVTMSEIKMFLSVVEGRD